MEWFPIASAIAVIVGTGITLIAAIVVIVRRRKRGDWN